MPIRHFFNSTRVSHQSFTSYGTIERGSSVPLDRWVYYTRTTNFDSIKKSRQCHATASVRGGLCILCRRKTNLVVVSVKDTVEALNERLAVDKVHPLSGRSADGVHDGVDRTSGPANVSVERPRPDLGVGNQRVRVLEVQCQQWSFDGTWCLLTEPTWRLRFWRALY